MLYISMLGGDAEKQRLVAPVSLKENCHLWQISLSFLTISQKNYSLQGHHAYQSRYLSGFTGGSQEHAIPLLVLPRDWLPAPRPRANLTRIARLAS